MRTRGHDVGRGLSMVHAYVDACSADEEFGAAMGAPMGELRHIIAAGRARQFRRLRRRVKSVTGLKWRVFEAEIERRTSARWVHFRSALFAVDRGERGGYR
jgi:hypothetical protein